MESVQCSSARALHGTLRFALFFFFNDTAPTEIYTLSLHDALPISGVMREELAACDRVATAVVPASQQEDRKSTRLNSSHRCISYAVFCLKKKKKSNRLPHLHMSFLGIVIVMMRAVRFCSLPAPLI